MLAGLARTRHRPTLRLETIGVSHFVEKVRWCMDRLGVPYEEEQNVGTLGGFFAGRTVPKLHVTTGSVVSHIGNSSDILRYLWGRYATEFGSRCAFLEPRADALEPEARLDRYGVHLQQWIYHHILHRRLTLRAWGVYDPRLPRWQRTTAWLLFPLLRVLIRRTFALRANSHAQTVARMEALRAGMQERLSDGRTSLLGGAGTSFVDVTLAALSGLCAVPAGYGAGKARAVMPQEGHCPADTAAQMTRWRTQYPRMAGHVARLYREERV